MVQRIKLEIQGQRYVWEDPQEYPVRLTGGFTHPRVILSQIALQPLQTLDFEDLQRRVNQGRVRLEESGLFYGLQLHLIASRQFENRYTLVIQAQEGFRQRYMADALWASWGLNNVKGRGDQFFLTVGYNRTDIQYIYHFLPGSPWSTTLQAGYAGALPWEDYFGITHGLGQLNYRVTPDSSLSFGWAAWHPLQRNTLLLDDRQELFLTGQFHSTPQEADQFRYGLSLQAFTENLAQNPQELYGRSEANLQCWIPLGPFVQKSRVSLLHSQEVLDPYLKKSLIDGYLRSGFLQAQGTSHDFVSYNGDLALPMKLEKFNLYPFVYGDLTYLYDSHWQEALGAGIHMYFEAPVFVDVQLYGGSNLRGEWTLQFHVDFGQPY
jgi:hypothetical protein